MHIKIVVEKYKYLAWQITFILKQEIKELSGWSAVASVTLNRVKDKRFPNTVCEVVKQGILGSLGKRMVNITL